MFELLNEIKPTYVMQLPGTHADIGQMSEALCDGSEKQGVPGH